MLHARLDKQLQAKTIPETLLRLGQGIWEAWILSEKLLSDARDEESIPNPEVAKGGKYAHTSYQSWVQSFGDIHLSGYPVAHRSNHRSKFIFPYYFPLLGDDL